MRKLLEGCGDSIEILEEPILVQIADRIIYGQVPFCKTFSQADLTADSLAIAHELDLSEGATKIVLFNNLNLEVQPSDVEIIDSNNARISLAGYTPINGIWRLRAL